MHNTLFLLSVHRHPSSASIVFTTLQHYQYHNESFFTPDAVVRLAKCPQSHLQGPRAKMAAKFKMAGAYDPGKGFISDQGFQLNTYKIKVCEELITRLVW